MVQVLRLIASSRAMSRKPRIWVMALLKRAGKRARRKRAGMRARRKTKLFTHAGTTAEGVQDEVVGSLAQGIVDGCHVFPSSSLDESASHRKRRRAWRDCWSSALHLPSYTVEANGSEEDRRARPGDASDEHRRHSTLS